MVCLDSNRYEKTEKEALIDRKVYRYGQNLDSSGFDLVGKNIEVKSESRESIDILLLRFGDSPSAQINNYYLESVPDELQLDDSGYESQKEFLPNSRWSIDPRQIRTNREALEETNQADWDFCYTALDRDQFKAFSLSFLGYEWGHWTDREWVSHQQEYF